jgi:hypothetical protein
VNRRELLTATAAAGAALALGESPAAAAPWRTQRLDFADLGPGGGWPGWQCVGVANLTRADGRGRLEAGSDVFPCDPRPVAFAIDGRFRDGEVAAVVEAAGAGAGVVLRRVAHRRYYAAIYDADQGALLIVRRLDERVDELARIAVGALQAPVRLTLSADGARPTSLAATIEGANGEPSFTVPAEDSSRVLQRAGDPGVLATAQTLIPSEGPPGLGALGNFRLLTYGVQEGQVIIEGPVGQEVVSEIRERSTVVFIEIVTRTRERLRPTTPSVVAATTGAPSRNGARLRVATDVPARVEVQISGDRRFRGKPWLPIQRSGRFEATLTHARGLPGGKRVYWRARVRRHGRERHGPVRSFRVLPQAGSHAPATIAIGSCASQFGPIFDQIAASRPDAFIWQGDLNYPDTIGPLAQTNAGYAGIWRDFLRNPRMAPMLETTAFAAQRDDHDYGIQDANSTNLKPFGLAPWDALMERRPFYRFTAGVAEFWVLDQRLNKSDPDLPDTRSKTLLGRAQRNWLLRTLRASRAPFKVICSPCTLAPLSANERDGSWAAGFGAERDLILDEIAANVSGKTLFVTGDTHWTLVYESDRLFEARPCPLGIPTPNDITITDPMAAENARSKPGVSYADDNGAHFALIRVDGHAGAARLDLSLVREDGSRPYRRQLELPLDP